MPTLVYLSGWTSTAVQTDLSMLESTPMRKEVVNSEEVTPDEYTKICSNTSSVQSQKRARTKKVPNKRKYGGVRSTLFNTNKRSRYNNKGSNLKSTCEKKRHDDSDNDSDS
jgi:hypothetical protein